jgi:hypothetical protein
MGFFWFEGGDFALPLQQMPQVFMPCKASIVGLYPRHEYPYTKEGVNTPHLFLKGLGLVERGRHLLPTRWKFYILVKHLQLCELVLTSTSIGA